MGIFNFFSSSANSNGTDSSSKWKLLSSEENLDTLLDA